MKRLFTICVVAVLAVISAKAQPRFERYPCVRDAKAVKPIGTRGVLPDTDRPWDPACVYRQLVILVSFSDQDFSTEDTQAYFDRLFNMRGFSERGVPGSVADYFRDQSNGLFNIQFDVFGPIKVNKRMRDTSYGEAAFRMAAQQLVDSLDIDFSLYDWDGDKEVDQVYYLTAGYCANGGASHVKGCLWPNTGSISSVRTPDGYRISAYSSSAEKWYNDIPCGLGTICHEFSHSLGLPDLYPTSGSGFSVVDEWDIMDGGNYTCWGWNPPNYSAVEKMLLGWLTPEDITGSGSITGMRPLSEGGTAWRSIIEGDEYYMLENRQQTGWDFGLPGRGLLITYVRYNRDVWKNNDVNFRRPYRYDIIHADGMDYDAWDVFCRTEHMTEYEDTNNRFRRHHLSTSPYPFVNDTIEVRECRLEPWTFTNIQMDAEGSISFDIVQAGTGIMNHTHCTMYDAMDKWYDLQGRRLVGKPMRKGVFIHNGRKIVL